jgi:Domain of Unknown Function (DUF1080)
MKCLCGASALGLLLICSPVGSAKESVVTPELSRISDPKSWNVINADFSTSVEKGKRLVRLAPKGKLSKGSNVGLALVAGVEFGEGTLEVDLKGKGKFETSFVGVAFAAVDGKTFEAVYFRPFNFLREPEVWRSHGVQYVAWPGNTWEKLRKEAPGKFESAVKPIPDPDGWFHARVEVTKQKVKVWVDDAKEPCLIVDRLAKRDKGKIGLWVDSKDGAFSNLKIRALN